MTRFSLVTRYVYAFDEPSEGGRELLGGKGIGLAEMTQLGVPVPAGFTITTDACRAYMREGGLPAGLDEEIGEHIARLEQKSGKRFGDDVDPLLVSLRWRVSRARPGTRASRTTRIGGSCRCTARSSTVSTDTASSRRSAI
jgi:pyruvate,orthophosphate dikinase